VYDHLIYDIVPDEFATVNAPDVLIVEGLNVLQPPSAGQEVALSDYFDFSIYIDADPGTIKQWYLSRFDQLWETAFLNPRSYFHQLTTELTKEQAIARAAGFWRDINLPNFGAKHRTDSIKGHPRNAKRRGTQSSKGSG